MSLEQRWRVDFRLFGNFDPADRVFGSKSSKKMPKNRVKMAHFGDFLGKNGQILRNLGIFWRK